MVKPNNQYARERRDKGLCGSCGNPALPGKTRCQTCTTKASEQAKARYRARLEDSDLCPSCKKNPLVLGKSCCEKCLEDKRNYSAERRESDVKGIHALNAEVNVKLIQQGICYRCKKNPVVKDLLICVDCKADKQKYNSQPRYDARKQAKLCQHCDNTVTGNHVRCDVCRVKKKNKIIKLRQNNICTYCAERPTDGKKARCDKCRADRKAEYDRRLKAGLCTECGKIAPRTDFKTCERCVLKIRKKVNRRYAKARKHILDHYGWSCTCCGENEPVVLDIDHVNNDGNKHRRELRSAKGNINSYAVYNWIINNNFPERFTTLCRNCNYGKFRYGGVCYHKIKRQK